mmetsp:Transcript_68640/g.130732  ORF Transcript_68640/g.130732 Transcript_68640/m.130732 type:complete len:351 (-) Transcript_68640:42-1094(-)
MASVMQTTSNLTRGTLGSSSSCSRTGLQIVESRTGTARTASRGARTGSRGYSRESKTPGETQSKGKPRGARAKLPKSCRQLLFLHDFWEMPKGLADAGVTHVRVVPAGATAELHLERRVSEKELADWGPALALVDEVIDQNRTELVSGARVLELGCGMGLPGMVCAALGADVVLTDQAEPAESLQVLEENARLNFIGPPRKPPGPGSGRASVRPLTWGEEDAQALLADEGQFDLVICSDCVYQPLYGKKAWLQLADTLEVLTGPDTKTLFTLQRRPHDGVEAFLSYVIEDLHLLVSQIPAKKHIASGVEIYTIRRPSRSETFHVDVQSSAEHEDFQSIVDAWRGVKHAQH